jgi:hypothetical protein
MESALHLGSTGVGIQVQRTFGKWIDWLDLQDFVCWLIPKYNAPKESDSKYNAPAN